MNIDKAVKEINESLERANSPDYNLFSAEAQKDAKIYKDCSRFLIFKVKEPDFDCDTIEGLSEVVKNFIASEKEHDDYGSKFMDSSIEPTEKDFLFLKNARRKCRHYQHRILQILGCNVVDVSLP
jgi:hypothetical protein